MITGFALATLNASLNSLSAVLMLLGYRAIKRKDIETHKRFMLAAFTSSSVFLASYLTRFVMFGDTKFQGEGWVRYLYFGILIPHVILAVLVAPAVVYTLLKGLRGEHDTHRRIASKVFPVWVYVSVTGVLVYMFLYQWFAPVAVPLAATPG